MLARTYNQIHLRFVLVRTRTEYECSREKNVLLFRKLVSQALFSLRNLNECSKIK